MEDQHDNPDDHNTASKGGQAMDILQTPKSVPVTDASTPTTTTNDPIEPAPESWSQDNNSDSSELSAEANESPETPTEEGNVTEELAGPVSPPAEETPSVGEESISTAADTAEPAAESTPPTTIDVTDAGTPETDGASTPNPPIVDQPEEQNPLAAQAHKQHASGTPIVAIVVAIVVALALAGLVVFMFTKGKSKQSAKSAAPSNSTSQAIADKPLASVSDVDATTQQIDVSLTKIDDTKDFAPTDLSDTSLGL